MRGPIVRLIRYSRNPYDLSVATARTCYSSKGIVLPEDVSRDERAKRVRDRIARSTLQAGHLTTRGHAFFVFAIDRISRAAIWSFLHSHPFYNSEQVSQRYVRASPDNFLVPPINGKALDVYLETISIQMKAYERLVELLIPRVGQEYFRIFPSRSSKPERWEGEIARRAYEVARYILPIATYAYMYHTINGVTLHRYARLAESFDFPQEIRLLVERMIESVKLIDPNFAGELHDPIPLEETPEYRAVEEAFGMGWRLGDEGFIREFDSLIGDRSSLLIEFTGEGEGILAHSVRCVLGLSRGEMDDEAALRLLLDPARNPLLSETLNPAPHSKLMRTMNHVHYVFAKKLSHTADSQDQRHRTVPGSRPIIHRLYTGRPDYVTPKLIRAIPEAEEVYDEAMRRCFEGINRLLEMKVPTEWAMYLLPNGFPIRFIESGTLMNLHHKWRMRLCFNAQEEIFHASLDEVRQVSQVHPSIARFLGPPCWFRSRSGLTPPCPEGDRFCGVRVWEKRPEDYDRLI
ncbi:TPA: FAD-dependent thymidylate synthase [Candidatus Poribacteria bacterium]|nr:FAD-dependent thymidylate synthase [Candidatus Poribacteria bacterium]